MLGFTKLSLVCKNKNFDLSATVPSSRQTMHSIYSCHAATLPASAQLIKCALCVAAMQQCPIPHILVCLVVPISPQLWFRNRPIE